MSRGFHKYPKLPKSLEESSLPFKIGSKITIKNYNTFLHNHESTGYKFWFDLNDNNKTGNVYVIGMTSTMHCDVASRLQEFFRAPNNDVDRPLIKVTGRPLHYQPGGTGVEIAPDAAVRPSTAIVPSPINSTVTPRPPSDASECSHARIVCEIAVNRAVNHNAGKLKQKCLSWMQEQYVRAVISIKILKPRKGVREPGTGYFFRTMTAKLYLQGKAVQLWDFGNVRKHSENPIDDMNDPNLCNTPNDPRFQISIPISEVFWDPPFPIPPKYVPMIPTTIAGNVFNIDLYRIQQVALESEI